TILDQNILIFVSYITPIQGKFFAIMRIIVKNQVKPKDFRLGR
ncbi:MAG: hypothetical protein RLZZ293_611, partial [Pseudomonadota bacterium]